MLTPIESPPTLTLRLAYWLSRRVYGDVMGALQIIYARLPRLLSVNRRLLMFAERDILPARTRQCVMGWVSSLNGCGFCADLHRAEGVRNGALDFETLKALANYAVSPDFDDAERAALAYAESIALDKTPSRAAVEGVRAHYSEREIVYLTWLIAMTTYLNMLAIPLGVESGGSLEKQLSKLKVLPV